MLSLSVIGAPPCSTIAKHYFPMSHSAINGIANFQSLLKFYSRVGRMLIGGGGIFIYSSSHAINESENEYVNMLPSPPNYRSSYTAATHGQASSECNENDLGH